MPHFEKRPIVVYPNTGSWTIENQQGFIFDFSFHFVFFSHSVVPALIDLRFDLAAMNLRIEKLFFTSNMLVKIHSDFLALGFLTGVGVMGSLGLLLVNTSGL